jgi:hypothetical protein
MGPLRPALRSSTVDNRSPGEEQGLTIGPTPVQMLHATALLALLEPGVTGGAQRLERARSEEVGAWMDIACRACNTSPSGRAG